ncbi:molybdopterin molybdotransferase MoeA, partial [Candidatus Woesearchaeota archaeon]|nr:molybdopterin molybdotransferase MoeA [Candidatus Woesearchaeota archaeon]
MTKQGFGKLASLQEAKKILFSLAPNVEIEEVFLTESVGRVIAQDVKSDIDVPHFKKSAMDGFAVIANDTFDASQTNPKTLNIIDSITAGIVSDKELNKGCCIEITTGAPLPKGPDAVLMVEYTEKNKDKAVIYKAVAPHENIIKIGSDIKKGEVVAKKGEKLTPRSIGVLSAVGINKIKVKKIPKIAYFSSGSEIIQVGKKLSVGKIFDINTLTITTALKEAGCEVIDLGLVGDELKEIKDKIKEGVGKSEIVILSGGSSLGGEDFMVEAVN